MKRILIAMLFATVTGALVFGVAASMDVGSTQLGSGSEDVTACDADGVHTSYTIDSTDAHVVETITVSDVEDSCDGQTLYLSVYDGTTSVFTASTVVTSGGTGATSYDFSPTGLAPEDVEDVVVTINGAVSANNS